MAKILFIASGCPPYESSENIINGKLVLGLIKDGHDVIVLTKVDEWNMYGSSWKQPWIKLQAITKVITYPPGNKLERILDILKNTIILKYPMDGIRWAGLAYKESLQLIKENVVDVIMTRSPSDIAHLVGLKLKKKTGIQWIANWNDPATGIWPIPYEDKLPLWKKFILKKFTLEALSNADLNTFPSQLLAEHFKQFYQIDRFRIIPHIMLPDFQNEIVDKNTAPLYICHSGNLSIERDPENLFLALKKFISLKKRDIYFDVLGVATPYALRLVETHDLHKYVTFIKPLPYYLALKKMAQYDILMIMEAKMGKSIFLPSKITDCAQLKKPILSISPSISEVGNLLNKYKGGIVANNASVDDIYEKLCLLDNLKSENKLNELIDNSSLYKYLDIESVLSQYSELLTCTYSSGI